MIGSIGGSELRSAYLLSPLSAERESSEAAPDNEAAEVSRPKPPLAEGSGLRIDLEA